MVPVSTSPCTYNQVGYIRERKIQMKIATKAPKAFKSPVRINDHVYEMWYSRPVNLGRIHKRGKYWYTEDGMRFTGSRGALEYLIRMHHSTMGLEVPRGKVPDQKEVVRRRRKKAAPVQAKQQIDNQLLKQVIELLQKSQQQPSPPPRAGATVINRKAPNVEVEKGT